MSENEILFDKKAKDAENDLKNSTLRRNQISEDLQQKKDKYGIIYFFRNYLFFSLTCMTSTFNRLSKTVHNLLSLELENKDAELKKGEDVVPLASHPDDPVASLDHLASLKVRLNL